MGCLSFFVSTVVLGVWIIMRYIMPDDENNERYLLLPQEAALPSLNTREE